MTRNDGKHPDGATLNYTMERGKPLVWDVTCRHPLSTSYIDTATGRSAAVRGSVYGVPLIILLFPPVAVETTVAMGLETLKFNLSKTLVVKAPKPLGSSCRSTEYLIQTLSGNILYVQEDSISSAGTMEHDHTYHVAFALTLHVCIYVCNVNHVTDCSC